MKFEKLLYIILAILTVATFVVPFVSAANPHTTSTVTSNGLIITSIFPDIIKQNSNYTFYWYVQNQTNSAFMNNNSVSCAFEIYKQSGLNGLHLFDIKGTFDGVEEWSAYVSEGNFSLVGDYIERVKCNSTINTGLGGISDNQFMVTESGRDYNQFNFIPMIIAFLGTIIVLIALAFITSSGHPVLGIVLAATSFFLISPMIQLSYLTFENSFIDARFSNIFNSITQLFSWMSYALIVYVIIYILIKVISNYNSAQAAKMEGLD